MEDKKDSSIKEKYGKTDEQKAKELFENDGKKPKSKYPVVSDDKEEVKDVKGGKS